MQKNSHFCCRKLFVFNRFKYTAGSFVILLLSQINFTMKCISVIDRHLQIVTNHLDLLLRMGAKDMLDCPVNRHL